MILIILSIVVAVLLIALWLSTMALWKQHEEEITAKTLGRHEVVKAWNKAVRLGRRSWYGSIRYSKQATSWSSARVRRVFITLFPRSKPAFVKQDLLTGLEHGPSSYFLANLTKSAKPKRTYIRKKKAVVEESAPEPEIDLSEEEKSDIVA